MRRKLIQTKSIESGEEEIKMALARMKSFNFPLALSVTILLTTINSVSVSSSPPIDYLIYTATSDSWPDLRANSSENSASNGLNSRPLAAPRGFKLAPIESIYRIQHNQVSPSASQRYLELENKTLALIRNSSHTHDNDLVNLDVTRYAWHLMEQQSLAYIQNRINLAKPILAQLLAEAQVSQACALAIDNWLERLKKLDHWAALMWNSWGQFPPAGLFEGSYTDLGSYKGCMSIRDNELIGQAQYCTIDYQPLVPTRPRFHSIYKRILQLDPQTNNLINGDFHTSDGQQINSRLSAHSFSSQQFKLPEKLVESNKYSKRTILINGTSEELMKLLENKTDSLNLTLNTEALVELASRAQYFYYVKFRLGSCLPARCSAEDVERLAKSAGQRAILQVNKVDCMKKEPVSLNKHQATAIWILGSLAFVAILGTVIDLAGFKDNHPNSAITYWLMPFSIWTNTRRLFDCKTTPGTHTDLECIHGLRFFSMIWVVYGHTILYTEYQAFTHFYDVVEKQIPSPLLLPSLNANFSVDTFFVISGILTTYVTWEYTKGNEKKFNKFAFAISRYIRLTPQLAIVMLCFFLLPLFGDGPLYKQVTGVQAKACYQNWHINLLYLQTYWNSERLCIDPSWWLSIEMTFHVISMLVIITMIKNVFKGMLINFALAIGLTLWGATIHYQNGFAIQYLPSIPQRYEVGREQTQWFFHRPYPHAASYFIGIALGYVLANKMVKKLNKLQLIHGWSICALGMIISLWGSYYWNLGAPYSQLQATIYYNLCQILWPTSIAWIILACSLGHGGLVNSILSAKLFVPLGRITYMTYLSHALIIYYHSASLNIPIEPSMMLFVYLFIANTVLALVLGILLTVVYESPLLNLQKVLFAYLTKKFDPTIQERTELSSSNEEATRTKLIIQS